MSQKSKSLVMLATPINEVIEIPDSISTAMNYPSDDSLDIFNDLFKKEKNKIEIKWFVFYLMLFYKIFLLSDIFFFSEKEINNYNKKEKE